MLVVGQDGGYGKPPYLMAYLTGGIASTSADGPPTTVKCRSTGALNEGGSPFQPPGRCCPPGGATTITGGYPPWEYTPREYVP